MKRRKRVYVAGPYTKGDVAVNVRNAIEAAQWLWEQGYAPYLPHLTHFGHLVFPAPYEQWIELDNVWVPVCDCLFRIPGESSGADDEEKLMLEHGKKVYHDRESLLANENPFVDE